MNEFPNEMVFSARYTLEGDDNSTYNSTIPYISSYKYAHIKIKSWTAEVKVNNVIVKQKGFEKDTWLDTTIENTGYISISAYEKNGTAIDVNVILYN